MLNKISRRTFLKSATLTTFACGAPIAIPASALGRDQNVAPSERITMGLIGCGSHGIGWDLKLMLENPMQHVVAVCDVDKGFLEKARERTNRFYTQQTGQTYNSCLVYEDFRDLVNRKDIDAVCIATPDHWHVLMSIFAMKAGKDVICEKPTLTIQEGILLTAVQKSTQRVYQTASENRSIDTYQQVVNLARNGHLGEVRHIKVLLPGGNTIDRDPNKAERDLTAIVTDIPAGLDYEKWSGPAPLLPFIPARVHFNWRWNFAYSGGVLTDWGSHMTNIAQWANNTDDTGPVEVQGTGEFPGFAEVWNTANKYKISYRYANGVTMDVWSEVPGIKIEGTKGWVLSRGWRRPLTASDESLLAVTFEGEKNLGRPESTVQWDTAWGGGEHVDFAHCVKSRKPCYYTAESGHRTHTIAHMGNISMLLGGAALHWNPKKEVFEGDRAEEANKHFCYVREQRDPWTFAHVDSWINVG